MTSLKVGPGPGEEGGDWEGEVEALLKQMNLGASAHGVAGAAAPAPAAPPLPPPPPPPPSHMPYGHPSHHTHAAQYAQMPGPRHPRPGGVVPGAQLYTPVLPVHGTPPLPAGARGVHIAAEYVEYSHSRTDARGMGGGPRSPAGRGSPGHNGAGSSSRGGRGSGRGTARGSPTHAAPRGRRLGSPSPRGPSSLPAASAASAASAAHVLRRAGAGGVHAAPTYAAAATAKPPGAATATSVSAAAAAAAAATAAAAAAAISAGDAGVAAGEGAGAGGDHSPATLVHHATDMRAAPVPGPAEARRLVRWIEMVIRQHGGRVIGANLGSALANSNSALYRSIKTRYGGLTPLLSKFPDHFLLESDPPFNHVALKNSPQAAAYHRTVRENAAAGLGPSGRALHGEVSSKSPAGT